MRRPDKMSLLESRLAVWLLFADEKQLNSRPLRERQLNESTNSSLGLPLKKPSQRKNRNICCICKSICGLPLILLSKKAISALFIPQPSLALLLAPFVLPIIITIIIIILERHPMGLRLAEFIQKASSQVKRAHGHRRTHTHMNTYIPSAWPQKFDNSWPHVRAVPSATERNPEREREADLRSLRRERTHRLNSARLFESSSSYAHAVRLSCV